VSTSPHDRGNRKKIGLALSGGGFRATVYHLGLVRFLFDAGILQNVTHITAVSGGSIFAAHLCLNWERYAGSAEEFDAAAMELLAFIQLDVRNRILRRFPLALPLRALRRAAGLSNRKLTRTGLLEYHYERYLYGDTSLFQLPENPRLHILATNLSEGRLCSFNRDGLWLIRREAGHGFRLEKTRIGLGTVSMAVAASSAFPGFFPPMSLSGEHVGATSGEFGRQFYTDGGVYDNLGVRMFHFLATLGDADERGWDGVLVSDVGKPFQVQSSEQAGGLVRTAMRSSDILMDRVWQLENETFGDAAGFTFAPITDVIDPKEDPTALHPEVQRQLPRIRTDLDDTHVIVTFIDTGGGMSPENLSRVFEPYFTTKPSGTGLGLLIVRRIVREHGGELSIESTQGKGLTLTIRLPYVEKRIRMLEAGESKRPLQKTVTN